MMLSRRYRNSSLPASILESYKKAVFSDLREREASTESADPDGAE